MNPRHLRWKTPAENEADKITQGTHICGERHKSTKLNEPAVLVIRHLLAAGNSQEKTAKAFGVTQTAISLIARGKNWRFVHASKMNYAKAREALFSMYAWIAA